MKLSILLTHPYYGRGAPLFFRMFPQNGSLRPPPLTNLEKRKTTSNAG